MSSRCVSSITGTYQYPVQRVPCGNGNEVSELLLEIVGHLMSVESQKSSQFFSTKFSIPDSYLSVNLLKSGGFAMLDKKFCHDVYSARLTYILYVTNCFYDCGCGI
jgi:hypothetical protein